jgi:hypothetical protein
MFSILDPDSTRETLDSAEKLTDWELFQNLDSEQVYPNIEIHSSNETDKAARDFVASIVSAHKISTRISTNLGQKHEIPVLVHLLNHKKKLRKLWQETRDPACK